MEIWQNHVTVKCAEGVLPLSKLCSLKALPWHLKHMSLLGMGRCKHGNFPGERIGNGVRGGGRHNTPSLYSPCLTDSWLSPLCHWYTPNHLHPLTYFSPCSSTSSLSHLCSSNPPPHSHKIMLCQAERDTERTQDVFLKTRPTLLFPSYVDSPCLSPHSWSPQCWSSCLGPPVTAQTFHHTRHSAETCGWGRGGSIGTCLWLAVGLQEFLWHFLWRYYT